MSDNVTSPSDRVSSKFLAETIGVTPRRVQQLAKDGILEAETVKGRELQFSLSGSVQAYMAYKESQAMEAAAVDPDAVRKKLEAEADYKRAKADQEALKLAELQGRMHRSEDVEEATGQLVYTIRAAMLAIPGRVAMDAQYKPAAEVSDIVQRAVYDALEQLSGFEYDPDTYAAMVRERESWSDAYQGAEG